MHGMNETKEESLEIKSDLAATAPLWRWTFEAALALPPPHCAGSRAFTVDDMSNLTYSCMGNLGR
jgi:hypothetical protein